MDAAPQEVFRMRLFRLYSGDDQQSHLEELEMPFAPGQFAEQTPLQSATDVIFTRMAPGAFVDWHNAPRRQYVITLAGQVEIGLSDGSLHRFGPGEGILAEDKTGKGHTTRSIGDEPRVMMIVGLKD
jgi:quercetin dioxygenase-like cupin family protein